MEWKMAYGLKTILIRFRNSFLAVPIPVHARLGLKILIILF